MSRELTYKFLSKIFKGKQAVTYVGLTPKLNESDSFKGRTTTLNKVKKSRIRAKVLFGRRQAVTHNPDMKAQKKRFLAAGKTKMQALGAAIRKLIQIFFSVIKNKRQLNHRVWRGKENGRARR